MAVLVVMQVPADPTTEVSGRSHWIGTVVQLWLELVAEPQIRGNIFIMTNLVIIDPDGAENVSEFIALHWRTQLNCSRCSCELKIPQNRRGGANLQCHDGIPLRYITLTATVCLFYFR